MLTIIAHMLTLLHRDEHGAIDGKSMVIGIVVGAAIVVLLAVGGLIKFLIPGE